LCDSLRPERASCARVRRSQAGETEGGAVAVLDCRASAECMETSSVPGRLPRRAGARPQLRLVRLPGRGPRQPRCSPAWANYLRHVETLHEDPGKVTRTVTFTPFDQAVRLPQQPARERSVVERVVDIPAAYGRQRSRGCNCDASELRAAARRPRACRRRPDSRLLDARQGRSPGRPFPPARDRWDRHPRSRRREPRRGASRPPQPP
jgi:hypothetical protein